MLFRSNPRAAGDGAIRCGAHGSSVPPACDTHGAPACAGRQSRPVAYDRAMTSEIEIGRSKRARQAYSFDDIALVPARRTRDVHDVRVGRKRPPS